jgi:PAS domain S-box-containing protein
VSPDAVRRVPSAIDAALQPFRWLGIRARLLFVLSFLALFGVAVATVFQLSTLADFTIKSMIQDAEQLDQQVTQVVIRALSQRPHEKPEVVLRNDRNLRSFLGGSISAYPYALYIAVVDPKGIVLASSSPALIGDTLQAGHDVRDLQRMNALARLIALQKPHDYEVVQPISEGDRTQGAIRVALATSFVRDALGQTVRQSLILAFVALVLAGLLALFLTDLTTRPLDRMLVALERLGRGENVERLDPIVADQDLSRLFSTFNTASARVAEHRTTIESRNQQLAALVDGLEDGVIMAEREGRIALANPIACRVLGRSESELVGRDLQDTLGAGHPLTELWRESLAQSDPRARTEVRLDADAHGDRYLLLAYPVWQGKDVHRVVLTLRNSDSLGKLFSLLDESHRMIAWGQVALGVAHEIRNPLQAMNINLELAREKIMHSTGEWDSAGSVRNLSVVAQQIRRLDDIVKSFLTFARMNSAERAPQQINAILSEVVSLVTAEASAAGVEIQFSPRPGLPTVWGDRSLLYQAFLNLLQNAIQAGPHRGPILVTIEPGAQRGVKIEVRDQGRGIKRNDQGHVFDLFFTTRENGSGIGLAVVQRTMQLHGGEIELSSEEGRGTTVRLSLPLNVPLRPAGALATADQGAA